MTDLEREVLEIINETIEGKYTGKLKVLVDEGIYQLFLYLDRYYTPIVLACEGNEDDFKKFVKNEIKKNKYEKVHFYSLTREPLVLDEEIEWDNE